MSQVSEKVVKGLVSRHGKAAISNYMFEYLFIDETIWHNILGDEDETSYEYQLDFERYIVVKGCVNILKFLTTSKNYKIDMNAKLDNEWQNGRDEKSHLVA